MLKQSLKEVGNTYRDFAGFDKSYDQPKDLCREAWKGGENNYLYIERCKSKREGKFRICNENMPNIIIVCIPETNFYLCHYFQHF